MGTEPTTWDAAALLVARKIDSLTSTVWDWVRANSSRYLLSGAETAISSNDDEAVVRNLVWAAAYAADLLRLDDPEFDITDVVRLVADKQADYGTGNILRFGLDGIKVRVSDKVERIKNLTAKQRDGANEGLTDAYVDIIGYAIVASLLVNGQFELPLERELPQREWVTRDTPIGTEVAHDDLPPYRRWLVGFTRSGSVVTENEHGMVGCHDPQGWYVVEGDR